MQTMHTVYTRTYRRHNNNNTRRCHKQEMVDVQLVLLPLPLAAATETQRVTLPHVCGIVYRSTKHPPHTPQKSSCRILQKLINDPESRDITRLSLLAIYSTSYARPAYASHGPRRKATVKGIEIYSGHFPPSFIHRSSKNCRFNNTPRRQNQYCTARIGMKPE